MTFENYDHCNNTDIIKKGKIYRELNKMNTNELSKYAVPKFIKIKCKNTENFYLVSHINSNILKSDIGNKIMDIFPCCDFSVVYSVKDNSNITIFSLRSTNHHTDVSNVAKILGGSGHRNASGLFYKCNYFNIKWRNVR